MNRVHSGEKSSQKQPLPRARDAGVNTPVHCTHTLASNSVGNEGAGSGERRARVAALAEGEHRPPTELDRRRLAVDETVILLTLSLHHY